MPINVRFGRKLRLPSTSVIKHQLRMMSATDSLAEACRGQARSPTDLIALVGKLVEQYKLSPERAGMLRARLGIDRSILGLV